MFSRSRCQGMDAGEGRLSTYHEDFRYEEVRRTSGIFEKRTVDEGSQRRVSIENRRRLKRGTSREYIDIRKIDHWPAYIPI